jgi:small conductance mechanosensitive channel
MPAKELILDLAIRYGFQVFGALVILGGGLLVAWWVGQLVDRPLQRWALEPPMRKLIVRAIRMVVLVFTVVVALDKFGFQIAPLVAGIGVAGLGIGLALQGVLSNVVAGLSIIFTKPFRVGEYIEIVGVHGDVATIELFSTTLLHPDRSRIVIPNRKIVGEILHNFGTTRQLQLAVTVPHETDLPSVFRVVREVLAAEPRVLADPVPIVGLAQIESAGFRLGVNPWVRVADAPVIEGDLYQALAERFRRAGIGVPLPRQEVRLLDTASVANAAAG